MKYLIIIILALTSCNSKKNEQNLTSWKVGFISDFWFVQENTIFEENVLIKGERITGQCKWKLIEVKKDSLIFNWTYQDISPISDSLLTDIDKLYGDTLEITSEFTVVYSANTDGTFKQVLNWSEIKDYQSIKFDSIFKEDFLMSKLTRTEKERIKQTFVNDTYLYNKIIDPIYLFHSPYSLEIGQKEKERAFIENDDSIKIEHLGSTKDNEYFLCTYGIKEKEARDFLNAFARKINSEIEISSYFNLRDSIWFNFNLSTNYPSEMVFRRSFKNDNKRNRLQYTIRKK